MPTGSTIFTGVGYPVLQNRTFDRYADARASATGEIVLKQDPRTGIIHNAAFRPELVVYNGDYDNEQGHSAAFRSHLSAVGDRIAREFCGKSILEVGCGKGLFLKQLRDRGFDVIGVDPSFTGSDPMVIRDFYSPDLGLRADAIVLRHVLEHILDPVAFLDMLRTANGGGLIYIEVPCMEWIAEKRAWFDIFYEHVNYFRLPDLISLFGRIIAAEHIFGGQYIGLFADLGTLRPAPLRPGTEFGLPPDFTDRVDKVAVGRSGTDYAVWGGASKGVIFSLLMAQRAAAPRFAIDVNPAKQGRFMPVSGVRILAPETALAQLPEGSDIVVMNENYLDEVRSKTGDLYSLLTMTQ
jgi:SAM-dependent methyltransferase